MKRGVTELNYLGSDIDSNLPKESQQDTCERPHEEMRPHDAYVLRLASVSDVHRSRLTRGRHIRDELRSLQRRCPSLNDLYQMHLADLEASFAETTQQQPQKSNPTVLEAVMAYHFRTASNALRRENAPPSADPRR